MIEVHAPDGTTHDGRGRVRRRRRRAARATTDAPDLVCDTAVLGMCALGGNRWSELAAAGRVDVRRPEALALADAMFLATPAPALLSFF